MTRSKKSATVYFIQRGGDDGPIKIGGTRSGIRQRLCELQVGSPERLRVLGCVRAVEADVQAMFERYRISGEWFSPHRDVLDFVRANTVRPDLSPMPRRKRFDGAQVGVRVRASLYNRIVERQGEIHCLSGIKPSISATFRILIADGLADIEREEINMVNP